MALSLRVKKIIAREFLYFLSMIPILGVILLITYIRYESLRNRLNDLENKYEKWQAEKPPKFKPWEKFQMMMEVDGKLLDCQSWLKNDSLFTEIQLDGDWVPMRTNYEGSMTLSKPFELKIRGAWINADSNYVRKIKSLLKEKTPTKSEIFQHDIEVAKYELRNRYRTEDVFIWSSTVLLILLYPFRGLILAIIWSIRTLKS